MWHVETAVALLLQDLLLVAWVAWLSDQSWHCSVHRSQCILLLGMAFCRGPCQLVLFYGEENYVHDSRWSMVCG